MIKTHWAALCVLAATIAPGMAAAGDAAGMVKVVKGTVSIERDGKRQAAGVGMPVEVADRIRTGTDGSVGVTLRDNTLLSAGPNSLVVIDKFAFDNATQDGHMSVGIRRAEL